MLQVQQLKGTAMVRTVNVTVYTLSQSKRFKRDRFDKGKKREGGKFTIGGEQK